MLSAGHLSNKSRDKEQSKTSLPSLASLPSFPLLGRSQRGERTLHSPYSPFKEVAINGWEPFQRHGVSGVAHDLGSEGDRRRLLGGLPALVHQVQVAVHSGDLIGREGVSAVVICKGEAVEIRTWLHRRAHKRLMTSPGAWEPAPQPLPARSWPLPALKS